MAKTYRKEIRQRGLFGKLFKWSFILFNLLMLFWLISSCSVTGDAINEAASDAESAGVAVGGALITGTLMFIWVTGDVILGLLTFFTRGNKIVIEEQVDE